MPKDTTIADVINHCLDAKSDKQIPSEVKEYIERLEKAAIKTKRDLEVWGLSSDELDGEPTARALIDALASKPDCLKD